MRRSIRSCSGRTLYAQSDRASNAGDRDGAIALLERAVALDSNFASAHRRLGVQIRNRAFADSARYRKEFQRAYDLRDRLTERERYLTEAMYHTYNVPDTAKAIAAYSAVLDRYPDDRAAANNLGLIYRVQGKDADALALYKSSVRLKTATSVTFSNAMDVIVGVEGVDSALALADAFVTAYPENPAATLVKADCLLAKEQYDSATVLLERQRETLGGNLPAQGSAIRGLLQLAAMRGRLNDAYGFMGELMRTRAQAARTPTVAGMTADELVATGQLELHADFALSFLHDTAAARSFDDQSFARVPVERRVKDSDGPYANIAVRYAQAGRLDLAHTYWQKYLAGIGAFTREHPDAGALSAIAEIERAEHKYDDAIRDYREARAKAVRCPICYAGGLAAVYADAGVVDSAIHYYDVAINAPQLGIRGSPDQYERFASLYEKRGDKQNALKYYQKVVDLWKGADPVLQPQVKAARDRIAALGGAR